MLVVYPETQIRRELGRGEVLIWTGRARSGVVLRLADIFLIPLSLLWCGFALFWMVMAIREGAPFVFLLFGFAFVLLGLYMVFGRFIVDQRQRASTCYGITSSRVIMISGKIARQTKSLDFSTMSNVTLSESTDGGGTITFGTGPELIFLLSMPWWGLHRGLVPSMELARDARDVYSLLNEARAAARRAAR